MRINNNLMAMNTHRQLGINSNNGAKSIEKLSSGYRINRAGDDAAGLAISEKMRAQVRGLTQASRNAQDGISMIQTAEGALGETHEILQRMRELSVQAGNDTNTADDRKAVGDELVQLTGEIDRISKTTSFNGKTLLNGSLSTGIDAASTAKVGVTIGTTVISDVNVDSAQAGKDFTFSYVAATDTLTLTRSGDNAAQSLTLGDVTNEGTLSFGTLGVDVKLSGTDVADDIGAALNTLFVRTTAGNASAEFLIGSKGGADETLSVSMGKIDSTTLGSGVGSYLSDLITDNTAVDSKTKAETLIGVVDAALSKVSSQRSGLGAAQNRLEHTIKNLDTSAENLQAAESRIRDVDMAKEMMNFTKNNILQQAAQAMLAQANQQPQGVLQLLR